MFLGEIIELKRKRLEAEKARRDSGELKESARAARERVENHRLREALKRDRINIIAEIKRASPSKGVINDRIDVSKTARSYEKGGAAAVSVLTEEDKFRGSMEDLRAVRRSVSIPVLRKDFVFDEFQIFEAAEAGADVVLLIATMLDDVTLEKLFHLAEKELGLDALVEVHTAEELKRAERLGARIIGVNNRDLHSFRVSLDTSRELVKYAPRDALLIAESGLRTREDLRELRKLGFSGFLIGETLLKASDPEEELRKLAANNTN
jgi:indole-3-glycerol phosphate synthase